MKKIIIATTLVLLLTNSTESNDSTSRWLNKSKRHTYSLHRLSDYTGTKNYRITVHATQGYLMNHIINRHFSDVALTDRDAEIDRSSKKIEDVANEIKKLLSEQIKASENQDSQLATTTKKKSLFN